MHWEQDSKSRKSVLTQTAGPLSLWSLGIHSECYRGTCIWEPAVLVGESKAGKPRSYIVRANNNEYRRNRKDILKTQEKWHSELADSADSDRPAEDTRQNESHWELILDSPPTISRVSCRVIRFATRYWEWHLGSSEVPRLLIVELKTCPVKDTW